MKTTVNGVRLDCVTTAQVKKLGYVEFKKGWAKNDKGELAHYNKILKHWILYG